MAESVIGYGFVLLVGLLAGGISGIVGFGSSIMLMPVLVYQFGPKAAVPIMAITALAANLSRILLWWREIDWRAFAAYTITAAPAAALGARTLVALPGFWVDIALGCFFILMVPLRHWLASRGFRLTLWQLALAGIPIGYLTGVVVSTGPISVPVFLGIGLVKGAFLATEAAGSLGVYIAKAAVFQAFGALPWEIVLQGLIAGGAVMAGSFLGKRFVLSLSPDTFRYLMDAVMVFAGSFMLWNAFS
ncbi:MAG: sulfite exporter TauE/SafE family protein [Ferrovibrio sp.]|nr:sulfite exporter TauE/SafE family protein [Ferrovibrio sp.]